MATIYDRLLLAKLETTKGTDSVPTAASNAVRVKSFSITKNTGEITREVVKNTMGNLQHLIGKETVQIEMVVEMRGSGTAGTAPEISPLMQACRNSETIVASTSVTYAPTSASASEKACTIYAYEDGLLWKFIGAVGTGKVDSSIDDVLMITFTLQAAYSAPTASTMPTGAVFDSTQPLVMSSATVINDGSAINVGTFGLDMGCESTHHYATNGLSEFTVHNRNPSMTFTKDSVSTVAEWISLAAGTTASLSATYGATAGEISTITAPVGKRKTVAIGERGERHTLDVTYGLYESSSDDQFSIAFT